MSDENQIRAAFQILECDLGCSSEQVKASYRQLVKVWHPDRFEGDSKLQQKATEKLKLINEAYQLVTSFLEGRQSTSQSSRSNAEPAQPPSSNHSSPTAESRAASFGKRSERVEIKEIPNSKTGQTVFTHSRVIKDFEGEFLTHRRIVHTTRQVSNGNKYDYAARISQSFHLKPEDGIKSKVPQSDVGLTDYDTKYSFPDGSDILISDSDTSVLFLFHGLQWDNNRSSLNEIKEDFQFFKDRQSWKQCVLFGQKAIDLHAQNSWGWIHRSYAMHCLSKTKSALKGLSLAAKKFPSEPLLFYNQACYCAQLGNPSESKAQLKTAFELARKNGSFDRYQTMAMSDSDLDPIRSAVQQIALLSKISRFF